MDWGVKVIGVWKDEESRNFNKEDKKRDDKDIDGEEEDNNK